MKRQLIAACAAAIAGAGLACWSSPGSSASMSSMNLTSLMGSMSAFKALGGKEKVASLANRFVDSSLKDPLLARLTAGKNIDPAATSGKVSRQLCAMLGGGCTAPLSDSQVSAAASKVSPQEATAISDHFSSALRRVVSNPAVRTAIMKAIGGKLPGVLTGFL